jgi:hypothetical protein
MKMAWTSSHRLVQATYFLIYLMIAHYILPVYNNGQDLSFFHTWSMFSNGPRESHRDLSFDDAQTFILRDYQSHLNQKRDNVVLLNYLIQKGPTNIIKIKKLYKEKLTNKFNHKKLEIFKIEGPLYRHIFYKQVPKVIEKEVIYNE